MTPPAAGGETDGDGGTSGATLSPGGADPGADGLLPTAPDASDASATSGDDGGGSEPSNGAVIGAAAAVVAVVLLCAAAAVFAVLKRRKKSGGYPAAAWGNASAYIQVCPRAERMFFLMCYVHN